jgi:hypothetical protein
MSGRLRAELSRGPGAKVFGRLVVKRQERMRLRTSAGTDVDQDEAVSGDVPGARSVVDHQSNPWRQSAGRVFSPRLRPRMETAQKKKNHSFISFRHLLRPAAPPYDGGGRAAPASEGLGHRRSR